MESSIRSGLDHPVELETLYRADRAAFTEVFHRVYPEIEHHVVAQVWYERLKSETETAQPQSFGSGIQAGNAPDALSPDNVTNLPQSSLPPVESTSYFNSLSWGTRKDWIFIAIASLLAGFIANIPNLSGIDADVFYPRNIGFIVLPFLAAYAGYKSAMPAKTAYILTAAALGIILYINLIPGGDDSDSITLAFMHLPLLLWSGFGFAYTHRDLSNAAKRLQFLKLNGELVVMSVLLFITGAVFFGLTEVLFNLIGIRLFQYLGDHFLLWILPSIPIMALWLVMANPRLVSMVSPVIARVFTPASLFMLSLYLIAVLMNVSELYQDRGFLLIFNLVLIAVIALILFSVSELSERATSSSRLSLIILFLLSVVTLLLNTIALSAILYRLVDGGLTPNRLAVLGANVLFLVHLIRITLSLYQSMTGQSLVRDVETRIATYVPVYIVWVLIVVFLFPLAFGFR